MQVAVLGRDRYDEIVETLWDAFRDYPVMRFVVGEAGDEYDDRGRRLVGYFTESRLARGWPVLGPLVDGLRLLSLSALPYGVLRLLDRLLFRLGFGARQALLLARFAPLPKTTGFSPR